MAERPVLPRCPSCGRFVGPHERCPYCGTELDKRLSLRTVKIAALLLAIFGLLGLWWMAAHAEVPLITAEEAGGTMNMAYVRLRGKVVRSLTYDAESGYLAFWLDDGTGEVRVSAYREVTEALVAAGSVPAPGDTVEVAGTLRVREDFLALTLNAAQALTLIRPEPIPLEAGRLTRLDAGERVVVQGEVVEVRTPYEGLTLITLRDSSGETTVAVDETAVALGGPPPTLTVGMGLVVTGTVALYHETPQIVPATTAALTVLSTPPPAVQLEVLPIGEVDEAMGRARVRGRLTQWEGFKGGLRGSLEDGSGAITLILWESTYEALPNPRALDVGATVEVEGTVKRYEGALEIVPGSPAGLSILEAATPLPLASIGELTAADEGRPVRLIGVLGEPRPFSAGVKVVLDDGSGTITLLLWSNVAEGLEPPPAAGQTVEVVGIVHRYGDELEVIPRTPLDWRMAGEP